MYASPKVRTLRDVPRSERLQDFRELRSHSHDLVIDLDTVVGLPRPINRPMPTTIAKKFVYLLAKYADLRDCGKVSRRKHRRKKRNLLLQKA